MKYKYVFMIVVILLFSCSSKPYITLRSDVGERNIDKNEILSFLNSSTDEIISQYCDDTYKTGIIYNDIVFNQKDFENNFSVSYIPIFNCIVMPFFYTDKAKNIEFYFFESASNPEFIYLNFTLSEDNPLSFMSLDKYSTVDDVKNKLGNNEITKTFIGSEDRLIDVLLYKQDELFYILEFSDKVHCSGVWISFEKIDNENYIEIKK